MRSCRARSLRRAIRLVAVVAPLHVHGDGVPPGRDAVIVDRRHVLGANLRLDLSQHLSASAMKGLAFVVNADNLTNRSLWLPDWGNSGDTIPAQRGRTLYFGIELSSNAVRRSVLGSTSTPSPVGHD